MHPISQLFNSCSGHLQELVESIGQEKAKVDEEVDKGREDEAAAAKLQSEVIAFQEECAQDLACAEPIIQVSWHLWIAIDIKAVSNTPGDVLSTGVNA